MAETNTFRLGRPVSISLTPDGGTAVFLRASTRSSIRTLYALDVASGQERVLATAEALLGAADETLSVEERARRERMRLSAGGIATYAMAPAGDAVLVNLRGRLFLAPLAAGEAPRELRSAHGDAIDATFSPDGKKLAVVRGGNLFVMTIEDGDEVQLTRDANEHVTYGLAEFVAQEEMDRFAGLWWSADGAHVLVERADTEQLEQFHIADPSHPERAPNVFPYPRAGKNNADVRLAIHPAGGGAPIDVAWDRARYPYLATARWPSGRGPVILVQNRAQTEEVLLSIDPATGASTALLTETDDAWLNLDPSVPEFLPDGTFLWSTEREGGWQLELHEASGALIRAVTPGSLGYRKLLFVEPDGVRAWVVASENPTETHVMRVPLHTTTGPHEWMTEGAGEHEAQIARNGQVWAHTADRLDGVFVSEIVRADGSRVAIPSVAERQPFLPNVALETVIPLRDGVDFSGEETVHAEPGAWTPDPSTPMHAAIVRPRDFDPSKKYPVILSVYGGPHHLTVRAVRRQYFPQQWFADHGFVVAMLDGRGTPWRGRAWERVIKNDLIAVPLADQIAGLRALAAAHPEMDLERVGVFGWSFGGYFSTLAALRAPHVFRAAVGGAPVTDWHDYDTHYTERYMGLPDANARGYERTSAMTWASHLARPLLLIHGTADDNVYFLHTLRLSDALLRAGKTFSLLPLAGFSHMVTEPDVVEQMDARIASFFVENLGGAR